MLGSVAALASIAAGAAAVIALGLGLTRTARLRRREQFFRETLSMTGLRPHDERILHELHRAALAELVSRQLTPPWRAIWPWFAWASVTGLSAQTAYFLCNYLASADRWDYAVFGTQVFGDTLAPIFALAAILGFLPQVLGSLFFTLEGRARLARRFYDEAEIEMPITFTQASVEHDYGPRRSAKRSSTHSSSTGRVGAFISGALTYGAMTIPGLFLVALGLNIGMSYWLDTRPSKNAASRLANLDSLGALPGIAVLSVSVLGVATAFVAFLFTEEVREHALPRRHPQSRLVTEHKT